jgi:GH15 family glucan-1,4-alpha-glucosidase
MASQFALPLEDYGLIGDCSSAALVGRNGSLDWLCWPRFDSAACFSALLGSPEHGRWSLHPREQGGVSRRRYCGETMILETEFDAGDGSFALIDFMPIDAPAPTVIRVVEGRKGRPCVRMDLTFRFDYGSSVPWVSKLPDKNGLVAIAGPNLVVLRSPLPLRGEDFSTVAEFDVGEGERMAFVLSYGPSHRPVPDLIDAESALRGTDWFWRDWSGRCSYSGEYRDAVLRSLLVLKTLSYTETGGIVAAPTTSLPEQLGGRRNWDYRYCWMRDATLTLAALMGAGYYEEAKAWREWLHRAVAGTPDDLQIMYGIAGERRLDEWEVEWLPGYQGASPVRIGNAASNQLQLDVWGEMMDALHLARVGGLAPEPSAWALQRKALEHLEQIWRGPDDGIWEVRGGRRHFTHSKMMAWVAFDRTIRDSESYGLKCEVKRWQGVRDAIHREVCEKGFNSRKNAFTQSFGDDELDASLLLMPQVGFLPADDPRVAGTIAAIERELVSDGLVMRYRTETGRDGLPPGEGAFLPCSFWLADAWRRLGRVEDSRAMLDRLLALRNDLGLLSEEYDTNASRLVGNFPQAYSHLSLVQTILGLEKPDASNRDAL